MAKQIYKIAVIGVGKIAIDQHLPVIDVSDRFETIATVSGRGIAHNDKPAYATAAELYANHPELDAVSLCMPPSARHNYVTDAIDAGKHVLLEKPPASTICEFESMANYLSDAPLTRFQTWHSQYNEAVDQTRKILADEGVEHVQINWRENVRKWHPGQEWVWEPGGFGVCDPGINALSIFTKIMPFDVFVKKAVLGVPENRQTPIDARIEFSPANASNAELHAHFNWLEGDEECWEIEIVTGTGRRLKLEQGGTRLLSDGAEIYKHDMREYEGIYARFAQLIDAGESDMDGAPLKLLADTFFLGARDQLEPFYW